MDNSNSYAPPAIPFEQTQEGITLANSWSAFGLWMRKQKGILQEMVNVAIAHIISPSKVEDLPNSEASLKILKQRFNEIESVRKEATDKMYKPINELMTFEKTITAEISTLTSKIIEVKKAHEAGLKLVKDREDEKRRVSEAAKNVASQAHSFFLQSVIDHIEGGYMFALGDGNISPDQLPAFLEQIRARVRGSRFVPSYFVPQVMYNQLQDVQPLVDEAYNNFWTNEQYIIYFEQKLSEKFIDYASAFANKEAAMRASAAEAEQAKIKLQTDLRNEQIANKLASVAVDASVAATPAVDTKELKTVFEIDNPDTLDAAILIMAAFVANRDLCAAKLKVTKWGAFTVSQMANALSKVKSDDNAFQPDGIVFKTIQKL